MRVVIAQILAQPSDEENELKRKLNLPLFRLDKIDKSIAPFFLRVDRNGLALHSTAEISPGELRVNFSSLRFRVNNALFKQNLLKAVGARRGRRPKILDATAGLGTDSFLLANAGCSVIAFEANPVVFALLEDGVMRYKQLGIKEEKIVSNLFLKNEDFLSTESVSNEIEVVYLDPMFPSKSKAAQAKKGMAYLQELVGKNNTDAKLFGLATDIARNRVVVKRAKKSPFMSMAKPTLSFKGGSCRFDVYLLNRATLPRIDS